MASPSHLFKTSIQSDAVIRAILSVVVLLTVLVGFVWIAEVPLDSPVVWGGGLLCLLGGSADFVFRPLDLRIQNDAILVRYFWGSRRIHLSQIIRAEMMDARRLPGAIPLVPLGWLGLNGQVGAHWVPNKGIWHFHMQRRAGVIVLYTLRGPVVIAPDAMSRAYERINVLVRNRLLGKAI